MEIKKVLDNFYYGDLLKNKRSFISLLVLSIIPVLTLLSAKPIEVDKNKEFLQNLSNKLAQTWFYKQTILNYNTEFPKLINERVYKIQNPNYSLGLKAPLIVDSNAVLDDLGITNNGAEIKETTPLESANGFNFCLDNELKVWNTDYQYVFMPNEKIPYGGYYLINYQANGGIYNISSGKTKYELSIDNDGVIVLTFTGGCDTDFSQKFNLVQLDQDNLLMVNVNTKTLYTLSTTSKY